MPKGKIAMIADRGFAIIAAERHNVSFDRTAVEEREFDCLNQGQKVQYELADDPDAQHQMPRARSVRVIGMRSWEHSQTDVDFEMLEYAKRSTK